MKVALWIGAGLLILLTCVVGAGALAISERNKEFTVMAGGKKITVKEGDWISLDGTTANVYLGQATTREPDPNSSYFGKLMQWADEYRGGFGVRANADVQRAYLGSEAVSTL